MGHSTDNPPLTSVQQCVVDALAAGTTLTDAAETYGVHRVTIYRWMKTSKPFAAALHRARAEFVLARRDDLYHLSNRALETLLAVLDNPKASPAVQLRAAMFILQRPQLPKTGWSMPEPAPDPDGKKLLDSAIIEQDYDSLPGLCNIEREDLAEAPLETETPAESATSEPPPPRNRPPRPPTMHRHATKCNTISRFAMTLHPPPPPARRACTPAPCLPASSKPATITGNTLNFSTCSKLSNKHRSRESKKKVLLPAQKQMRKQTKKKSWCRAPLLDPVIGRFLGDHHVVYMALAQARGRHPQEPRSLVQCPDVRRTAVPHAGLHAAPSDPMVAEILNLQPRGSFAKPYQVKQVRNVIVRYKLGERAE